MPRFIYKAKRDPQRIEEGTIAADNKSAAIQQLSRMGFFVISIEEYIQSRHADGKSSVIFRGKVSSKDISDLPAQAEALSIDAAKPPPIE